MIYTLALAIIFTPIVTDILRTRRAKKIEKINEDTVQTILTATYNLQKSFSILLTVLHGKYANNLTLEIAKVVIELVYYRAATSITNKIRNLLHDSSNFVNGKLDIVKIKDDMSLFISNKYYQDIMILNKMTCGQTALNFYLSDNIKHEDVTERIMTIVHLHSSNDIHRACTQITQHIDAYFLTLINKTKNELERISTQII